MDNAAKFPEAATAVKQNFYMDDYLESRPTLEGIESLAKDLIQLLSSGGFKLTKWISNAPLLADRLNIFADLHHNRQTQLSLSSSIEDIDKTRRNTMSSPRQRTSKSTQLGSSEVSQASPRYHTTRHSTLKVKAVENLTAVEKMSLGDAVNNLPSEAKHATWPESTKNKQCEDCPSSASIVSPATPANPSVLGLRCNTDEDALIVSRGTTPDLIGKTITQRLVLSTVSSVFDPIGLIAPFTIHARLLLKQLWKSTGQQWDEEIPEDSQSKFLEWCSELENISKIAVPRAFFRKPNGQYELHVFGDASAEAFAAVAYLRQPASKGDETSQTAFIIGKARVAPMKLLTIPKLELQAALLASRLKCFVEDSLTIPINKVNLWTDSTTVCQLIRSSASKHPIFVANRLSEILELTSVDQWKFVPGSLNPADSPTRGFPANRLNNCSWIPGPSFLKEEFIPDFEVSTTSTATNPNSQFQAEEISSSEKTCLKESEEEEEKEEEKEEEEKEKRHSAPTMHREIVSAALQANYKPQVIPWNRISNYNKLIRVFAYILRLLQSHYVFRQTRNVLHPEEYLAAEKRIFILSQKESFAEELKHLRKNQNLSRYSRIIKFNPFLGSHNLLRSTGRTSRMKEIPFEVKHPIFGQPTPCGMPTTATHTSDSSSSRGGIPPLRNSTRL